MVSPRKTNSVLSLIPEEHYKMMPSSTKSCESLYSNTSSSKGSATVLYRKSQQMGGAQRQSSIIPATTEVRQRVLSARRLRMKTYQNQLADAQQTIADLAHENRILRTLHKRQDSALAKYESTNAELPQLLHSHAEELRVWQAKYRNLQTVNKELEQKLKQKEAVILSLSDQNKYYSQLNRDKNLDERQRLTEKLHALETRLQEKDNDMKLFARKMQLESKNFKKQLQLEQKKYKEALVKLEKTRLELSGYRKLDDISLNDKFSNISLRRKEQDQKIAKTLETPLEQAEYNANQTTDEDLDYLASHRSTVSNTASKIDFSTTRTVKKQIVLASASPAQKNVQHHRRIDRSDGGDTAALNEVQKLSSRRNKSPCEAQPLYSDDFEVSDDLQTETADTENGVGYEDVEEEEEDNDEDDDTEGNDDSMDKTGNTTEPDDVDKESNYELNMDKELEETIGASKPSTSIKEDISIIRKQISADYKEREAFLDTFCRQATSSTLHDEPPKVKTVTINRNMQSNRKHKLLAALKAINDNKSED